MMLSFIEFLYFTYEWSLTKGINIYLCLMFITGIVTAYMSRKFNKSIEKKVEKQCL